MRIIPALDIIGGKCVRLTKGDYATQKTYSENPLEVAKAFEANGIRYLHLVDLDGAKAGTIQNQKILEKLASNTSLDIDFGGGLKSANDIRIAFESGAKQVTGGSIAVRNPDLFKEWLRQYGPEKIILGADVSGEQISVSGWQEISGETLLPFVRKYEAEGIKNVICTDIAKDGMLQGPSFDLYRRIRAEFPNINLIASGGICSMDDLLALQNSGCEGAIVGKAIYEGYISLAELGKFINNTSC